jgi:hypothetical protein
VHCSPESQLLQKTPWKSAYCCPRSLIVKSEQGTPGKTDFRPGDARQRQGRGAGASPCPNVPTGGRSLTGGGPCSSGHAHRRTSDRLADGDYCRQCSGGGNDRRMGIIGSAQTGGGKDVAGLGGSERKRRAHGGPRAAAMVDACYGNWCRGRLGSQEATRAG